MAAEKDPAATGRRAGTKGVCSTCDGPVYVHETWEGRKWRHTAGRGGNHPVKANEVTGMKMPAKDYVSRIQLLRNQGVKSPAEKAAERPKKPRVEKPPRVVDPKRVMVDFFDKKGRKIDYKANRVEGSSVPRGAHTWVHPFTGESGEVSAEERARTEALATGTPFVEKKVAEFVPEKPHDHPWSAVQVDGNDLVTGPSQPNKVHQFRQLARAWAIDHWNKAKEAGRDINTRIVGNYDSYDPNYGNWEVQEQAAHCTKCHPENPKASERPPLRQNGDLPGHLADPEKLSPWHFPSTAPIKEGNKRRYPTTRRKPNWDEIAKRNGL